MPWSASSPEAFFCLSKLYGRLRSCGRRLREALGFLKVENLATGAGAAGVEVSAPSCRGLSCGSLCGLTCGWLDCQKPKILESVSHELVEVTKTRPGVSVASCLSRGSC